MDYGGLQLAQAKRLKDLQEKNQRLKKAGGGVVAGEGDTWRGG
jgi:hypothetical protein